MNDENIKKSWEEFIDENKEILLDNKESWYNKLEELKKYINEYNKTPSSASKINNEKLLASWLSNQKHKYKNKKYIILNEEIYNSWTEFITEYKKYFLDNETIWNKKLEELKIYINEYNKHPSSASKNNNEKILGNWISVQQHNYKNKKDIMENEKIYNKWTDFITEYKEYFSNTDIVKSSSIKSTTIKIKSIEEKVNKMMKKIHKSSYQLLSKLMSSQNSLKTKEMFNNNPDLWNEYHNTRDISFKKYNNQNEIPINKIINYLEKIKYKLKILDLGCGRNLIKKYFKDNNKFNIIGYDYISYNNSIECDISNLPDEDESIKICIYSQSLMGSNWKEYLKEGYRVLEYNGEMIIAESIERYEIIKKYLAELNMKIIIDNNIIINKESNRWFIIHTIKQ
jgi:ubiquinone/menaquinone biosynthesis C-methylase UbiE